MTKTATAIVDDDAILAAAPSAEDRTTHAVQPFRASGADAFGRRLKLLGKFGHRLSAR